ncbi:GNAT family N-acetyltransferase [Alphaproteobacteria bacterium KMM 3653]|uniref:L-ornithine N(alpha)-acyltransferase n=1 Tax=Harenicola maris TaxID=2841044 RepID=A0AAP2G7E4_9RHOB|nr:GNAT family N-acetyltransferase [Harenicola maris]
MTLDQPELTLRLASGAADLRAAQRLRYRVFVAELGADCIDVDHGAELERDVYDAHCDHLILVDPSAEARGDADYVVGVYRVMRGDQAKAAGGFYSRSEYDLAPLIATGQPLLELGRSCVAAEHRGGKALFLLWQGLAQYVETHGIEILFGVASFHGTDPAKFAAPLSLLHHRHLAPEGLRPRVIGGSSSAMDLMPMDQIDRVAAMRDTPALIKAYLRLGGFVGEGAFIDRAFNTIDVSVVLEASKISQKQRAIYAPGRAD